MHQGLFLTIEGSDGSGKGTQYKLLIERLKAAGYDVAHYDFPQYDRESSYFVKQYLNGSYGSIESTGPYIPSVFFALDRFDTSKAIHDDLAAGKVVLSNRFAGSSMAHQGAKFNTAEERAIFFKWIDQLEFGMLGLPRPQLNLLLLVPAEIGQEKVGEKRQRGYTEKKRDIHEANLDFLTKSTEAYQQLAQTYPESYAIIDCMQNEELMSITAIHNLIWERIEPMLERIRKKEKSAIESVKQHVFAPKNEEGSVSTSSQQALNKKICFTPTSFDKETRKHYQEAMSELLAKHAALLSKLNQELDESEANLIASSILPVATQGELPTKASNSTTQVIVDLVKAKNLQPFKGDDSTVELIDYWPKNELALLPSLLFSYSSLDFKELSKQIDLWSYDEKAEALKQALRAADDSELPHYVFDLLGSYQEFQAMSKQQEIASLEHQQLTPHYGYVTPDTVTKADLDDLFSECFESSLQLYHYLLDHNYPHEAQYATLLGHKLRWKASLTIKQLDELRLKVQVSEMVQQMFVAADSVHPLAIEGIAPSKD